MNAATPVARQKESQEELTPRGELDAAREETQAVKGDLEAARGEIEASKGQFETVRIERDTFAAGLKHLKDALGAKDFEKNVLQAMLRKSNASLSEKEESLRHIQARQESVQVELAHSQRLIIDQESQLRASRAEFQEATQENQRLVGHLAKHEQLLAEAREETGQARKMGGKLGEDLKETRDELSRAFASLDGITAERDKLRADLSVNFELVEFNRLKENAGVLERALAEDREKLARALRDLENARAEVGRSHEAWVRVELELAASRDALSESKQEQDNAVLRDLVTRLNEELDDYRPSPRRGRARRAAKARDSRGDTGFFRWLWSRRLVIPER